MSEKRFRTGVFISYSHKDYKWLRYLRTALAPAMRGEELDVWDDTQIQAGTNWESEIRKAISCARVAVLLVSPDFLASEYVTSVELPTMLKQQPAGLTILWVPIRASDYRRTRLNDIQAAHDPSRPLASLSAAKRDEALVKIANRIARAADINAVANALTIIDRFYPQLDAFVEGRPEPVDKMTHSVLAKQEGETIVFESATYPREEIRAEDISKLDKETQKLIRAYERTMQDLFDRWVKLKPKRVSRDPEIKKEAIEESDNIRHDLCHELNELLDFFFSIGKQLYDHYAHIFFICGKEKRRASN